MHDDTRSLQRLGLNLLRLREGLTLSQEQLAEKAELTALTSAASRAASAIRASSDCANTHCCMRNRLESYVSDLIAEENYEDVEGVWLFRNGMPCSICTSGAMLVARHFEGEVWGYFAKDNRGAKIGFPIVEGHDFAWIAGRWLVDYWAYRVAEISPQPVLDLQSPTDWKLAIQLYGDAPAWSLVAMENNQPRKMTSR